MKRKTNYTHQIIFFWIQDIYSIWGWKIKKKIVAQFVLKNWEEKSFLSFVDIIFIEIA